ncbi:hypothetical protein D9V80_01385 [Buchnera aphidicola (Thelaxes californica)]|uniref:DNA polymerase III subunit delta' n=2 Tax=Buchnera aphidicola TaxID=9 RepID=A0A4D6YM67_9GAMM|nr:hypothetical protein D9V80_01385 [Buchnera aphidicola (Thelaxes californica)]
MDTIQKTINHISKTSKQGGLKIIWIDEPISLTHSSNNALLKTLEEPPNNTFFFLTHTHTLNSLNATLYSRCYIYTVPIPDPKISLHWLIKKTSIEKKKCKIALDVSNNYPIEAINLLQSHLWNERKDFFKKFYLACKKKNFFLLLPEFQLKNYNLKIEWIFSILLDALRFQYKNYIYIYNQDQLKLIKKITKLLSNNDIDKTIRSWLYCKKILSTTPFINVELIIAKELIKWTLN